MKKIILLASVFSSLAFAANADKICEKDRINIGTRVGTVLEIFSNGKARIEMDDSFVDSFNNITELGRGVNCFKHICRNDRINIGSRVGKVLEVFDNGTARLKMDDSYGEAYKNVTELGKGFKCVEEICQGDRVEFNNRAGKAIEIFDNGVVRIDVDDSYGDAYKNISQLGYSIKCSLDSSSRNSSCHGRN